MGLIDTIDVKVNGGKSGIYNRTTYITKILKPNMVGNRNILTQRMLNERNTKYVIRWDYVLDANLVIPEGCLLEFDGGSIKSDSSEAYTITCNNTVIVSDLTLDKVLEGVTLAGTYEKADADVLDYVDSEDITIDNHALKLADKEYDAESFSGLGRVYLRKSIVDNRNVLTSEAVSKPNIIYIIQYDFDLNGESITIPEGCVLEFEGGSLRNGTIVGNNTKINGDYKFNTIRFAGSFSNEYLNLCDRFTDFRLEDILHSFKNAHINLDIDIDQENIDETVKIGAIDIEGNGHTIKIKPIKFNSAQQKVSIKNIVFDCSYFETFQTYQTFRDTKSTDYSVCKIDSCTFNNIKGRLFHIEGFSKVIISNCSFSGTLNSEIVTANDTRLIHFWKNHSCEFINNTIHDVNGRINFGNGDTASDEVKPLEEFYDTKGVIIKGNHFERINGGAVVLKDGLYKDVVIKDNYFSYVNLYDNTDITVDGQVVNVHGFNNLLFSNNLIENCQWGHATIDFNGSYDDTDNRRGRGDGLVCINNTIKNGYRIFFFVLKNATIANNYMDCAMVALQGCFDTDFVNNVVIGNASAYGPTEGVIFLGGLSNTHLSEISIKNLKITNNIIDISQSNGCWAYTPSTNIFDGYLIIEDNDVKGLNPFGSNPINLNESAKTCLKRKTEVKTFVVENTNNQVIPIYNVSLGNSDLTNSYKEIASIAISRAGGAINPNDEYFLLAKLNTSTRYYIIQKGNLLEGTISTSGLNTNYNHCESILLVLNCQSKSYRQYLISVELVDNEAKNYFISQSMPVDAENYDNTISGGGYMISSPTNPDYSVLTASNRGFTTFDTSKNTPVWWASTRFVNSLGYSGTALLKGNSTNRPVGVHEEDGNTIGDLTARDIGFEYNDLTLKKHIYAKEINTTTGVVTWVDSNGNPADIRFIGNSTNVPTTEVPDGFEYYATDLHKPIYWNAAAQKWYDASGNQVTITQVATPVISYQYLEDGNAIRVGITCETDGATIYYTDDGTTPGLSPSTTKTYSGAVIYTTGKTIKAFATKTGLDDSEVVTETIKLKVITPKITQNGTGTNNITMSCDTAGASIFYTTDGKEPGVNPSSTSTFAGPFTASAGTIIRAIAQKAGYNNSAETYLIVSAS